MVPYLRCANVLDGRIDYSDVNEMHFSEADQRRYTLRPADILLNEGQSTELVGRSAIYDGPEGRYCYQNSLVSFRCGAAVVSPFARAVFKRWLDIGHFTTILKQTTSMAHLGGERFAKLEFPLPPLPEQRQIAAILDTIDHAIRKTEQIIAKLKQVKQGLLHDLLTRGIDDNGELRDPERHPEQFKDSALGRIPKGWDALPLVELTAYQNGAPFPSNEYGTEGVRLLRPGNIREDDFVVWDARHTTWLPSRWAREATAYLVGPGEIVMNLTAQSLDDGFLGRVCLTTTGTECLLNQRIARFRPRQIETTFLFWSLKSTLARRQIDRLPQGTKVQHLYNRNLDSILLPKPQSSEEQAQIGQMLLGAGARAVGESGALSKLRLLKAGLLEDLLTGRVRVTPLLEEATA